MLSLSVSKMLMLCLLVEALMPGDAAPTTTGQSMAVHHIPLSRMRLPDGASGRWTSPAERFHSAFQEKTAGGNVGIFFNTSSYILVGTVNVGSPGR